MKGFNKTLDVNLEHTELGYTQNQSIKHQQSFRKEENTKQLSSPLILFDDALLPVPSSVRFLIPPQFLVHVLLMMFDAEFALM